MELTLYNQHTITNNELIKDIAVIDNCITSNFYNSWQIAFVLARIKDNDLFEFDFDNFNEFCKLVLNKSQARVNRVINATRLSLESQFDLSSKYTVTQICELAPLGVELIDDMISNCLIVNTMTCKELRQIVKDQKALEKSEEIADDKDDKDDKDKITETKEYEEIDSLALWLSSCPYQLSDKQYQAILDILN